MHRFNILWINCNDKSFDYQHFIYVINIIDCKHKSQVRAYLFALFTLSKSSTICNILVFEDLKIIQICIDKVDEK